MKNCTVCFRFCMFDLQLSFVCLPCGCMSVEQRSLSLCFSASPLSQTGKKIYVYRVCMHHVSVLCLYCLLSFEGTGWWSWVWHLQRPAAVTDIHSSHTPANRLFTSTHTHTGGHIYTHPLADGSHTPTFHMHMYSCSATESGLTICWGFVVTEMAGWCHKWKGFV